MTFTTINPATEEVLQEYVEYSQQKIDDLISAADARFKSWRTTSFANRADLMMNAARILIERKDELGRIMAVEMGKPLAQGKAEAEKCALCCRYYAENAERQLRDQAIATEMQKSYVSFQPIGAILAIMPWNFPFWQVFRFAAPTLMAGNVGLLKHSRNTMGSAVKIEEIFTQAGFPEGCFTNFIIGSDPVAKMISHPLVKAVTLTGSTPVGASVAAAAGANIKKTVMELGGSDPYVVLADADLDRTVESCVNARLINSGQSCIAAKRFIVNESIVDEFARRFVEIASKCRMGNPLEDGITVGPQARKDLQLDLQRQVDSSTTQGAKLLLGGKLPDGKGYFYPPSVLTEVRKGMAAFDEELFGPVAAIIPAQGENEAVALANDSIFGLGAAIYTQDIEKGEYIARTQLQAGACFVNDFVRSDPRLPFGGIKQSGYGRELSNFGIQEFVNIKTVVVS